MTLFRNRFFFNISQHLGPTYIAYKISAKYTKPFWRIAILTVLLFLVSAFDPSKFYYFEALESDHAAYEI